MGRSAPGDALHLCAARAVSAAPKGFRRLIEVGAPAVVRGLDQRPRYWHCPLLALGRVVGFLDFSLRGRLLRYGFRVKARKDIARAPIDLLEMPVGEIRQLASSADSGPLAAPVLVCLEAPTRLAWRLRARLAKGAQAAVFVTPGFSWRATSGRVGAPAAAVKRTRLRRARSSAASSPP